MPIEGPIAAWLFSVASTPYLKQVSRYVVVLWCYRWLSGVKHLSKCGMDTDGADSAVEMALFGLTSIQFVFSVTSLLLSARLALGRIAALEASMLRSFHSRRLGQAAVILGVLALALASAARLVDKIFAWAALALIGFGSLPWRVLVLRAFAASHGHVREAAHVATGRRKEEAARASKTAAIQLAGLAATFASTDLYLILYVLSSLLQIQNSWLLILHLSLFILDPLANAFGALALSGALSGAAGGGEAYRQEEEKRSQTWKGARRAWRPCPHEGWRHKVVELGDRGFTLEALLIFYARDLRRQMPNFDPARHRTSDVVRLAIIPLSIHAKTAYAVVMMDGKPTKPMRMVTHNWGNLFRDLVSAIVADALDEDEYEEIANLLDRDVGKVQEWVRKRGVGDRTYWVCAFSVSQHSGICSSNPYNDTDPVTGLVHGTCACGAPKHFNVTAPLYNGKSIECEMNKFDEMMAFGIFIQILNIECGHSNLTLPLKKKHEYTYNIMYIHNTYITKRTVYPYMGLGPGRDQCPGPLQGIWARSCPGPAPCKDIWFLLYVYMSMCMYILSLSVSCLLVNSFWDCLLLQFVL